MPKAYEGNEPYIFISYAHKDKDEVLRYVDAMQRMGFRVWFDAGIEAGSEWPENIARHLRKCACVIAFVSRYFIESDNCRREIAFSQDLKIEQLSVFIQNLQPCDLPDGMRLQLGLNQALFRENFETDAAFVEEISCANMLEACRGEAVETALEPAADKEIKQTLFNHLIDRIYDRVGHTETERREHCQRVSKAVVWICALLELAYIPLSTNIANYMAYSGLRFVYICLLLLIAHFMLAWCSLSFYVFARGMIRRARIDQKPLRDARYYMHLATLASFLVPTFTCIEGLASGHIALPFLFGSAYLSSIFWSAVMNAYAACVALLMYSLLKERVRR